MREDHGNFNHPTGGVIASLLDALSEQSTLTHFDCYVYDELIWLLRNAPDDSSGISLIERSLKTCHEFVERRYGGKLPMDHIQSDEVGKAVQVAFAVRSSRQFDYKFTL